MAEENKDDVFKETLLTWVMKGFSFTEFVICFLTSLILTILIYPILAPLESKEILVIVFIITILLLLGLQAFHLSRIYKKLKEK